jgi:hypothetical protein
MEMEMETSMTNFQLFNSGRVAETIAGQIQPLGQSTPLSSAVKSQSQVSKMEFATGMDHENKLTGNLQHHRFYRDSGPLRSALDPGEDSTWNGKPYHDIGVSGIGDYSNQGAVETFRDIRSSVDYSSFLSQSIASPYATALPPGSGNFILQGGPLMATPPGGDDSILRPTNVQKRSVTRASLKGDSAGSGLLPRNNLKVRSPPSRKLAGVNGIRKMKKEGGGMSPLIKAFPLIGELKDLLKVYPSCAVAISLLEESIGETVVQESRASRPSLPTYKKLLDIASDNYSAVDSYTCGDSTSISATSDFSCPSQNGSSITFPSSDSIPNEDFMDMTTDNETPRAGALNTTIYHCTVPAEGKLCKFSAHSERDWVRHEESDKHWPQKRFMCINCIDLIKDEEGNSLCVFCFQRLPPVGSNKAHYLQCQKAQRSKHVFNAARNDHFRNHLKKHGIANITPEASTWTFNVESDWHRQCGFCTQTLTTWEERKCHVAKHFQQGMNISSWKLPSPKRKRSGDNCPGIDHRSDDDDDDDDDSQNNRPKSNQTPTGWFSGQPFSGEADNFYVVEEWPGWMDGGTYDAQAQPTSTEKVEAYLKHQSQVESKVDDGPLNDTKSRDARCPENSEIPLVFNEDDPVLDGMRRFQEQKQKEHLTDVYQFGRTRKTAIMRLLEINNHGKFSLTKFIGNNVPPYAILSHTWGSDTDEVSFRDITDDTGKSKAGYDKIWFCGRQARRDGLQYFWVDTCCIDISNNDELSEAINSMFRWYCNEAKCYVYLPDVSRPALHAIDKFSQLPWELAFQKSRWFTRGWTLQELVAPTSVEFFSQDGEQLGNKRSLERHIHKITGIPIEVFQGGPLSDFGVIKRLLWADKRETTRKKDEIYSLLGLISIHMPLIYGEGRDDRKVRRTYMKGVIMPEVDEHAPLLRIGLTFLPGADKLEITRLEQISMAGQESEQKNAIWRVNTAASLLM